MNNEIILRSAYGKVNQIYFIQPCPNPRTGRLPDCVRLVKGDPDKGKTEMILSEDDVRRMNFSIDRVDSSKGYVTGNVVACHKAFNNFKSLYENKENVLDLDTALKGLLKVKKHIKKGE
jgi:hypothetical protein